MNFAEQEILAELYAQSLEEAGYRVDRRLNLGSRESVQPSLESGQIDLYPEYLASLLAFVSRGVVTASSDPATSHRLLQDELQSHGMAVLEYAPAANTNGFVVTRPTADRYDLRQLSDLAPVGQRLVLGGPPECPVRPFCLPGLRDVYGIAFRDFRTLDAGGPLTLSALESGQIDVALLFTTDPLIDARGFILLEDDRHLQLAENVAPAVRADLLQRVPADFARSLDAVSGRLTTAELTLLNGQVLLERQSPRAAAAAWLRAQKLIR